ncbi:asparagine synthase (glutamine-hydrolyzing) [bacterium]|nr:asparagine synthase (glutamine-hydrolyzing) [bacterium]
MCGIFGFYTANIVDNGRNLLKSGLKRIHHRGPDDEGLYEKNNFFMGMRRLSIIDLSGGSQPFYNEDKTIAVVFNGELYNYKVLKQELITLGHIFKTNSDTEIIAHMFEEFGPKFPEKLNGMFAIALYCVDSERLYLFRDRFGIKPLYYFLDRKNKRFSFASELKSFDVLPFFKKRISKTAVSTYIALGHIPAPESIIEDVYKLRSSHYLSIGLNDFKINIGRYYQLTPGILPVSNRRDQVRTAFELLRDSVCIRTLSDVPLGVFLSGGIDSSAIVAMLSISGIKDIKTFAVSFKGEGLYDESPYAKIVADHFKTDHHELEIKMNYNELLEKFFYHYDEPFADSSAIPTFAISSEASKYVKVVLSGTGGDEVFLGYRRYLLARYLKILASFGNGFIRNNLKSLIEKSLSGKDIDRSSKINSYMLYLLRILKFSGNSALMQYIENMSGLSKNEYSSLLIEKKDDYYNRTDLNFGGDYFPSSFDFSIYLESDLLVKEDRATMANSLEGRVPFLDHRLVEAMYFVDEKTRIKGNSLKYILKKMLSGLVPGQILNRPKQGFAVPIGRLLESEYLSSIYKKVMKVDPGLKILEFINRDSLVSYINNPVRTDDKSNFIWRLIVLEKYLS